MLLILAVILFATSIGLVGLRFILRSQIMAEVAAEYEARRRNLSQRERRKEAAKRDPKATEAPSEAASLVED